jgi:hypothetical protein
LSQLLFADLEGVQVDSSVRFNEGLWLKEWLELRSLAMVVLLKFFAQEFEILFNRPLRAAFTSPVLDYHNTRPIRVLELLRLGLRESVCVLVCEKLKLPIQTRVTL